MRREEKRIRTWITALAVTLLAVVSPIAGRTADRDADTQRGPQSLEVVHSDARDFDEFGQSISGSGSTWVIGSPGNDGGGTDSGAAYVYEIDAEGNGIETKLIPAGVGAFAHVGNVNEVALDGDTLILGVPGASFFTGTAWVFERRGPGIWDEVQTIRPADVGWANRFGDSVAIEGDLAVFGAPTDGIRPGSIYVYERDAAGTWQQLQRLSASDGQDDDQFGWAVALDGDYLVVGAPHSTARALEGQAYVFRRGADGQWAEEAELTHPFQETNDFYGISVAIDASGDRPRVMVGANNSLDPSAAYVFERDDSGVWTGVARFVPEDLFPGDFADAVALSGDLALVGDPGNSDAGMSAGAVFGYQRQADGSWLALGQLVAPRPESQADFGSALAMDDTLLLVGTPGSGLFRGSVWVFALP